MFEKSTQSEQIWKVSLSELINIFRESLINLIPVVEQAKIPWQEGKAYDAWDEIAQTLFKNIVAENIKWAFPEEADSMIVQQYDMNYSSYSGMTYIQVIKDSTPNENILVFNSFTTRSTPFDTIKCACIDSAGSVIKGQFEYVYLDGRKIELRKYRDSGDYENISILNIQIT